MGARVDAHEFRKLSERRSKMDEMLEIVRCKSCRKDEYQGCIHWRDGLQYCRRCIYEIWSKESDYVWRPKPNDYVFPLYSDGKDYTASPNKKYENP